MIDDKLIVVSLTSWPKRIKTVHKTIDCLLNQTIKPDAIELNLSLLEFPNGVSDLPNILQEYSEKYKNTLHINFIEGNTKAFKKIIPTIKKYYGNEYFLLSVDDDGLYSKDYIKIMLDGFEKTNCDYMCMRTSGMAGGRMIYKSSCFGIDFFKHFEELPPEVIDKSVDDSYYSYYLNCKGKKLGNIMPNNFNEIFQHHDENSPLTEIYRKPGYLDSINNALKKLRIEK